METVQPSLPEVLELGIRIIWWLYQALHKMWKGRVIRMSPAGREGDSAYGKT